jgi:DNA-binding transcriptional MerR regulator
MAVVSEKAAGAFRTIGELSRETGIPQHILRYWETRFPQLRPLQRAGRRRYYRPDDVALVLRISTLLDQQGYTIRGVQQMLSTERKRSGGEGEDAPGGSANLDQVKAVRDRLARALREDLP